MARLARLRVGLRGVHSDLIVILRANRVYSAGRRSKPRVRSLARLVLVSHRRVLRRMIDVAGVATVDRGLGQGHQTGRSRVAENLIGWHVRRESTGREDLRRDASGPALLRQHLELGQLA